MGSGTVAHEKRAAAVGEWLATERVHLLTGGGRGVMEAVSRAFHGVSPRAGLVIGIVPGNVDAGDYAPREGYPNPWVEIPIYTHLSLSGDRGAEPLSRNHINVLSANVLIALPGSLGTASEVALARRYGRPLIAYLDHADQIEGLPSGTVVEPDLERVQQFVRSNLTRV
jgi:uncharacterized protein (TIGR00725 family)